MAFFPLRILQKAKEPGAARFGSAETHELRSCRPPAADGGEAPPVECYDLRQVVFIQSLQQHCTYPSRFAVAKNSSVPSAELWIPLTPFAMAK